MVFVGVWVEHWSRWQQFGQVVAHWEPTEPTSRLQVKIQVCHLPIIHVCHCCMLQKHQNPNTCYDCIHTGTRTYWEGWSTIPGKLHTFSNKVASTHLTPTNSKAVVKPTTTMMVMPVFLLKPGISSRIKRTNLKVNYYFVIFGLTISQFRVTSVVTHVHFGGDKCKHLGGDTCEHLGRKVVVVQK